MTALHVAINKGLKDMAFLLIDMGADLEAEDIDNKPPVRIHLDFLWKKKKMIVLLFLELSIVMAFTEEQLIRDCEGKQTMLW